MSTTEDTEDTEEKSEEPRAPREDGRAKRRRPPLPPGPKRKYKTATTEVEEQPQHHSHEHHQGRAIPPGMPDLPVLPPPPKTPKTAHGTTTAVEDTELTPAAILRALYGPHSPFISPRHSIFIENYLTTYNATRSARAAGYADPNSTGCALLEDKRIKAAIAYRMRAAAMAADEVMHQLAAIARADIAELINPATLQPELIDTTTGMPKTATITIKRVTSTKDGTSLELYSRLQALELIGRMHGLFVDKHQHQGIIGVAPISAETLQHIAATATEELTEWERRLLEEPTTTVDTTPTSTTTTATASEDT